MTDDEWAFFSRYVESEGRGRPASDHRRVLDAIFLIALTGQPWRSLPGEFGNWGTVYQQFRRWTRMGLWQAVLDDLDAAAAASHPHRPRLANGTGGGMRQLREKVLAARALARRQVTTGGRRHVPATRP